ncbi:NADP-dependent oxidoreductase [Actinomadura vinacea]|uniref:NADP-dependent oxidoreductase n=1 Tax=Actinomadura vinacea TaxID=115336 RepID=A0ABN3ISL7_9ACTN
MSVIRQTAPAQMRAVQFHQVGGREVLQFVKIDVPVPGPKQIVVAIRMCGMNPADWAVREGVLGLPLPLGSGFEAAGAVSAVGADVEDIAVGDLVFGNLDFGGTTAGAAEYALMDHWATVPDGMSLEQAAAIPMVAETALRTLDELGVQDGHTLLINGGSGAVGQLATQLAVRRGAEVIVTSGTAKAATMRKRGAKVTSYGEGLDERVRALAPDGVDLVLDMGPSGALPTLIRITGDPARVLTISDFANADAFGVRTSGRGNTVFRWDALQMVADGVAAGSLSVPVWRVEPWENIAAVQEAIKSGTSQGKTVLRVSA